MEHIKMRQPLLCCLAVEFPAKLGLEVYLVLSADVFPRQQGFGGLSRVALRHFPPPKGFWRGISAHKFNSHTKKS